LFERLVHRRAIFRPHLVELVDRCNSLIGQHKRTSFERPLLTVAEVIAYRSGRETGRTGAFAGGVDGSRSDILDI